MNCASRHVSALNMVIDSAAFGYPLLYLDLVVLARIAAGYSLLAIWAGVSRRHWFIRASALTLSLLALLPIQAHQPALMLAFALPALTLSVAWLNRRGIGPGALSNEAAAPGRLRFGLRDLLLSVLLVAMASFGVTILIERRGDLNWQHLVVGSPSIWLLGLLSYLVSFARERRMICAVTLVAAIVAFAGLEAWPLEGWRADLADVLSHQHLDSAFPAKLYGEDWAEAFVCILLAAAVYALLLAGVLLLSRDQRPAARRALGMVVLLGGITGTSLYWHMVQPSTIERDDPLPNSYPKLLKLAQRVKAMNPNHRSLDEVTLTARQKGVVEELRAIYEEARRLVRQAGHVDLQRDDLRMDDFPALAESWNAEGTSLIAKNDLSEAARYGVAAVELGAISSQRGLLTHWLMGRSCEEVGARRLRSLRHLLPVADAREVVSRLIAVDRRREPYEFVTGNGLARHPPGDHDLPSR